MDVLIVYRYLEQLRLLAANWGNFDSATRGAMKNSPFLLASQRVPARRSAAKKSLAGMIKGNDTVDDEYEREWVLCKAAEVGWSHVSIGEMLTSADCYRR
jgi:hypothetical protein